MDGPEPIVISGVRLKCSHCGSHRFRHRRGQVNSAWMTFFNLDWLDPSADIYICQDCGFLHWFFGRDSRPLGQYDEGAFLRPQDVPLPDEPPADDDTSVPTECLACGEPIPAGCDTCPKCGWSYRSREE